MGGSGAPSLREPIYLWEADHDYYCNEGNYFSNDCYSRHKTWAAFHSEADGEDLDYNLIFRWDWKEGEDEGATDYTGDDYYRNGILQLFYMGQRKGLFRCVEVEVCRADEPAVRAFLEPRLAKLLSLWEPLASESNRKDGSTQQGAALLKALPKNENPNG